MRERNLYRGTSDFQGSIDEDGRIYDERHRLVGRIEGNVVYDSCNIKQGTIDENGKLWDVNHTYVGQARGSNFIGPSYQSIGMTRGDSTGEGDGSEYGALMMLKKRNEYYSGNMPDSNYDFGNDYSSGGRDDEEDDDEDYEDDDWEDEEDPEEGFDFGDEDTTVYEVECACGEIIDFDEETLEKGSIVCPNCGETLEFSLDDEDEE